MTRKTKRIMVRIMAVVMAITLIPSNMWGTANVVMAEEMSEAFTEEDVDVTVEDVQEPQEEADEKETVVFDGDTETETSAPVDADEIVEDDQDAEGKEEKKETEKVSEETDNKAILKAEYVHNFTTDGLTNRGIFEISGTTGDATGTYTDKDNNVHSFTKALKTNSSGKVIVKAPVSGTLIVVKPASDGKTIAVGDKAFSCDDKGVIETSINAGNCEIKKGSSESKIFYIAFIPEGADKSPVKDLKANPTDDTEVKIGDTITLSCSPLDATIYYTTDGTEPKNNDSKKTYSNGIAVVTTMVSDNQITIKAYASKPDEYADSETVTFTYNVSAIPGENQLKTPTAEPDSGEVPRGTKVTLKSEDGASIYYTTDETNPGASNTRKLFTETDPIVIDQNTVIKAVAEKEGKDTSFIASFTYTIKKAQIKVDPSSASIISSVALDGDMIFKNGEDEAFDISLKAVENTNPDNGVKSKAEALQEEGGKILYYDFSLMENGNEVLIEDAANGVIKIKMPYSIASNVDKRNQIAVVNETKEIETTRTSDGFEFNVNSVGLYAVVINPPKEGAVEITEEGGYEEGAYAEWEAVDGADGYMAYVAKAGGEFERIDDELIREYKDYWRVDTVGLAKGAYYIKIAAVTLETKGTETTATVIATNMTNKLNVTNYDRSGFAFSKDSKFGTGSGAYNDDGTLRKGAQIVYVTADTANICKAKVNGTEVTGFQSILDAKQKKDASDDIIDFRIIGCVSKKDLDHISSSEEGLQVKGANEYQAMNITIEGIGEDAAVHEFGFLLRNCGNVELRNFAVMAFMDDGISLDTKNCNIWVHDLDIFYGSTGGDSDQAKGDGSLDVKGNSQHCTFSYNHFWDSGKCSLCGMKSESGPNYLTYHHNWFDHSDSRHPRIRTMSVHVYNNFYDGNSKYGVGVTMGSSAFVEANYFRNCKNPMLSSGQGTDATGEGTFSGENGGIIKAYNNVILGTQKLVYANAPFGTVAANSSQFDAYLVSNRSDEVPNTIKTVAGSSSYDNFDTIKDLGVKEENVDTPENVPTVVTAKAGRLNGGDFKWTFDNATEDINYAVIAALKTAIVNYKTTVKAIGSGVASDVKVVEGGESNAPSGDTQVVNPPTASMPSGEVEKGTEITLSGDGKIYYTLTGLEPTTGSTRYTAPIVIDKETTIKAIAVVGTSESQVATFKYTIPGGTTPTPPPGPNPGGDDDDKPARGTYTLDIKEVYATTVSGATTNREETKGTNDFFTLLFAGKESGGSAISEKSSELEFEDGYKSNRYFLTSGIAKTNQASVKIVTKAKTTVTVWWQPGSTTDLQQRQLTVLNTSSEAAFTSNISNLDVNKGYVTPFELPDAGTYYIGSAKSSINIYKIEVKYPETGGGDDAVIDPPTATPDSGNLKKGGTVTLNAAGDIYYTMTTDGSDPAVPATSNEAKYTTPITVTAEISATVKIKAITVSDGKRSDPATFSYTIVEDTPEPKEKLSNPEASPAPVEGRTYPVNVEIGLTSKENGTIYYTMDGSEPKKQDGTPSEKSKTFSAAEPIKLSTEGMHTIKAFAVKEGYPSSDTATFTYTVSANSTMKQLAQPAIAPASKAVKKGEQIAVTITKAEDEPEDTEIYYTTDGTVPTKDAKLLYKNSFTLTVDQTTTIKAIAVKDGAISSTTASVTYTVKEDGAETPPAGVGLRVVLKNKDEVYTYTGSAIMPDIVVWNYSDKLVEGVDYTVKYKNNINVSADDEKDNKKPQIIVTGKGNLTGSASTTFKIVQKSLMTDVVVAGVEKDETLGNMLLVVENSKPDPVLYYGGAKLNKKDYTVSITDKCVADDTGKDIKITGQGNYTGELNYKLKVIAKDQLKKFAVAFSDPGYTYNGSSQMLTLDDDAVKDSSKTDTAGKSLIKDTDYAVVYQKDTTNAGKVKFTVVGLGYYTGSVTKTYTIKPIAETSGFAFTGVGTSYSYVVTGVTIPTAGITYNNILLEQGKDYKLTYGNNKKVGTTAKISAVFMGNYKGSKIDPVTFEITQGTLNNQTEGLKIAIADKVYTKPGVYKSVPYVSVNGVEVKSSEYTVQYYTGGEVNADKTITIDPNTEMGSKNKIELSETEKFKTVYVELTGKGKNYADTMKLTASYNVYKAEDALDLSKAKITVYKDWAVSDLKDKNSMGNKMEYTGIEIEPSVMIEFKDADKTTLSPQQVKALIDENKITIQYTNNVNKGKATIVINGNGIDYVGGKTVTFSITTKSLKDTDVLVNLFKNVNDILKG